MMKMRTMKAAVTTDNARVTQWGVNARLAYMRAKRPRQGKKELAIWPTLTARLGAR